jgi:hypothetical protein
LISKAVELSADVLSLVLAGVLALPVSSSSTVKGKFVKGGVEMTWVILAEVKVSPAAPVEGEPQLVEIPPRPVGKDAAPVFTHHS